MTKPTDQDMKTRDLKCKICGSVAYPIFRGPVLGNEIQYYHCNECGFLCTEEPYWLAKAYNESINSQDTGILQRNLHLVRKLTSLLFFLFQKDGKFLDYAGGYGIFVRAMRDVGFDFYWLDAYTDNILARGFEYNHKDDIELITCFEAIEHFIDPLSEIEQMLSISKNILLTTEVIPENPPEPGTWAYYGPEHGQHISFFSVKTLQVIAKKYNLKLLTRRNIHLLTNRDISKTKFNLALKFGDKFVNRIVLSLLKSRIMDDYRKMGGNI